MHASGPLHRIRREWMELNDMLDPSDPTNITLKLINDNDFSNYSFNFKIFFISCIRNGSVVSSSYARI